jgi:putative Holliday junction resolvase
MGEAKVKPLRLLLGFDYGSKQIGVAVGQVITGQARELCILKAQNGVPDWQKVEALIKEWQPDAIVVGLPLNMDGSAGPRCQATSAFARNLERLTPLPITYWDERLSTVAATRALLEADTSRKRRAEVIDHVAAAYILQGALDRITHMKANP